MIAIPWTEIVMSVVGALLGGGISALYYRRLTKKQKSSSISTQAYIDYEKVIDLNTARVEKLRTKIDELFTIIDGHRKDKSKLESKLYRIQNILDIIIKDCECEHNDELKSLMEEFDNE